MSPFISTDIVAQTSWLNRHCLSLLDGNFDCLYGVRDLFALNQQTGIVVQVSSAKFNCIYRLSYKHGPASVPQYLSFLDPGWSAPLNRPWIPMTCGHATSAPTVKGKTLHRKQMAAFIEYPAPGCSTSSQPAVTNNFQLVAANERNKRYKLNEKWIRARTAGMEAASSHPHYFQFQCWLMQSHDLKLYLPHAHRLSRVGGSTWGWCICLFNWWLWPTTRPQQRKRGAILN